MLSLPRLPRGLAWLELAPPELRGDLLGLPEGLALPGLPRGFAWPHGPLAHLVLAGLRGELPGLAERLPLPGLSRGLAWPHLPLPGLRGELAGLVEGLARALKLLCGGGCCAVLRNAALAGVDSLVLGIAALVRCLSTGNFNLSVPGF